MAETKRPTAAVNDGPDTPRWENALHRTVRMESAPRIPLPAPSLHTEPSRAPSSQVASCGGVELVVVEESQVTGAERRPWRAAEVWTKRRVYGLDSTFRCVEVLDRSTGRLEPGHELIGARLGGGRLRTSDVVRFSYPLPLPGMEAMFLKGKKHGYTSVVERMIVRVRVLDTSPDEVAPTWEDIANRWSEPPDESGRR